MERRMGGLCECVSSDRYRVHSIIILVCVCLCSSCVCVAAGVKSSSTTPPNGERHTPQDSSLPPLPHSPEERSRDAAADTETVLCQQSLLIRTI